MRKQAVMTVAEALFGKTVLSDQVKANLCLMGMCHLSEYIDYAVNNNLVINEDGTTTPVSELSDAQLEKEIALLGTTGFYQSTGYKRNLCDERILRRLEGKYHE